MLETKKPLEKAAIVNKKDPWLTTELFRQLSNDEKTLENQNYRQSENFDVSQQASRRSSMKRKPPKKESIQKLQSSN